MTEPATSISESDRRYFKHLRPKRCELVWLGPNRCAGGLFDPSGGCKHVVPLVYARDRRSWPRFALCPLCGRRYDFVFWKLKRRGFEPTPEQEADVRALLRDLKRVAKGKPPQHGISLEQRVALWCLRGPGCTGDGHAESGSASAAG